MQMIDDITLQEASAATVRFERALESLVLEAFAEGAAIEGTWEIEPPVEGAPNWAVEVTRADTDPAYTPRFVDE